MKPFLLLQLRPLDEASDNEFDAFLKYGELNINELHRVRMEVEGIPNINLNEYSAILLGGGPSNVSDKEKEKEKYQIQFEQNLNLLFKEIFRYDFPFLGVCYGIGAINKFKGGVVSKDNYSEDVGAVEIELTKAGKNDDLLKGLPDKFEAYSGHKEACQTIPKDATLLASSKTCPFQMIRFKKNIYAMQFHTELDQAGIRLRIEAYRHHGYFSPENAQTLIKKSEEFNVEHPSKILYNFIKKYRKQ